MLYLLLCVVALSIVYAHMVVADGAGEIKTLIGGPATAIIHAALDPEEYEASRILLLTVAFSLPFLILVYWQCRHGFSLLLGNVMVFFWILSGILLAGVDVVRL